MNEGFIPGHRRVHAGGISQHQRVVSLGMAKVPADALLFHQTADEVEVGLAMLHTVGPLTVGAGQLELDLGGAVIGKNGPEDVGDGCSWKIRQSVVGSGTRARAVSCAIAPEPPERAPCEKRVT